MAVPEARLRATRFGLAPDGEGWFVLNAVESRWRDFGRFGAGCDFEGERPFRQLGVNLNVLGPGEPLGMYHRENHQEGFLVLSGECMLIVEEEERPLRQWDYFHCPAGTRHVVAGAGDGPCAILMLGARPEVEKLLYPVSDVAAKYGASVATETSDPDAAYADWPGEYQPVRLPWPVG